MCAHADTEDQLVEQPAIGMFAELGWSKVSAMEESFGATGTLVSETPGEVVLVSRLRAALSGWMRAAWATMRCRPRPSPPPWMN